MFLLSHVPKGAKRARLVNPNEPRFQPDHSIPGSGRGVLLVSDRGPVGCGVTLLGTPQVVGLEDEGRRKGGRLPGGVSFSENGCEAFTRLNRLYDPQASGLGVRLGAVPTPGREHALPFASVHD